MLPTAQTITTATSAAAPMTSAGPTVHRGIVKQVLSGDAIIIRGQPKGGPPPEKQVNLSNIVAPKLARRPVEGGAQETKDEVRKIFFDDAIVS